MSKIGVFDSGLGGLSVLKEMMKVLPNEDFLFYEDSLNNPYGVKDEDELLEITSKIVDYLLDNDCKIIVIACNTATTCCMKALREKYPNTIFVGTVPAIKVAYDNNYKNTIILSTPYTTKSKRVEELLNDYTREDQIITNISGENLANLIELDKHDEIMELLHRLLDDYKDKADSLVLGCTHYSLIKAEINEVLPNTVLLDGCLGVANEVKHQLEEHNLLENNSGSLEIVNSKSDDLIKRSYEILNN
ncbi:MAG: glutamate racemase [Bacilli bacterium]|nr:glutamate racemase [Bacilli bacterium]